MTTTQELGSLLEWPTWAWHEKSDGQLVEPPTDPNALVHGWLLVWSRQGMPICKHACPTPGRARIAHQIGFVLANEFVSWSGPKIGETWVSVQRLADRLGTSKKIVSAVLRELHDVGAVQRLSMGKGKRTLTILAVPDVPRWLTRPTDPHHSRGQVRDNGRFVKADKPGRQERPTTGSLGTTQSEGSEELEPGPWDGPTTGSLERRQPGRSTVGTGSLGTTPTEVVKTEASIDGDTNVSSSPSAAGFDDRRVEIRLSDGKHVPVAKSTADRLVASGEAELVHWEAS